MGKLDVLIAGNYTCEVEWGGHPKQIVHTLEVHVPPHVEAILPSGYGQVRKFFLMCFKMREKSLNKLFFCCRLTGRWRLGRVARSAWSAALTGSRRQPSGGGRG